MHTGECSFPDAHLVLNFFKVSFPVLSVEAGTFCRDVETEILLRFLVVFKDANVLCFLD